MPSLLRAHKANIEHFYILVTTRIEIGMKLVAGPLYEDIERREVQWRVDSICKVYVVVICTVDVSEN